MANDTEMIKLIESIKMRPELYDRSNKRQHSQYFKMKMWDEVCSEVLDLEQLRKQGKSVHEMRKVLMGRWQSMKTQFARDLNRRKKKHTSHKQRKSYKFFNQLLFLTKHVGHISTREDQGDVNMSDSSTEPNDSNLKEGPTEVFFVDCSANIEDNFKKETNEEEFLEEESSRSVEW